MDTARGLLMPMPTMAMVVMEAMAAMVAMDTARGLLMPMPTMAMVVMEAMAAMVAMDTARGLLMLMPTMAMVDMAAMAMVDTAMASNQAMSVQTSELSLSLHHTPRNQAKLLGLFV